MTDSSEAPDFQALWRSSTMPDVRITLRAFATQADATQVGEIVGAWLRILGAFFSLKRLDGVTVAYDYDQALAELDKGFGSQKISTATRNEFAVGIAMAVTVLRNGKPRSHLVINAGVVEALKDDENPNHDIAFGILAHEAAHVHDLEMQDVAFPGVLLQKQVAYRDGVLLGLATLCWEEYIASRLSASFQHSQQLEWFETTLCAALQDVRERGNNHIREYRLHSDIGKLMERLQVEYGTVLKYSAYLLGHIAGADLSFASDAPKAASLIESKTFFASTFKEMSGTLETMWATYGHWTEGIEIFAPLKRLIYEFLKIVGVDMQEREGGKCYIDVPFTLETMPLA
jgi:hypothetical protein